MDEAMDIRDASSWWPIGFDTLPRFDTLRRIGAEAQALAATALAMPLRPLVARTSFDPSARHPVPVVFVHGFLGDPSNFVVLQRFLHRQGVRNFASFAYGPRIDYHSLVPLLRDRIADLLHATGAPQVDVVGHSLGGLVARCLTQSEHGHAVRRLVTLGAPYFVHPLPEQELAIFGGFDAIVPSPSERTLHAHRLTIPSCGHLGLLYHPTVLRRVARFFTRPSHSQEDRLRRAA
jgi:pimeloyl-ACP methyl ester carboxylesterase